MAQTALKSPFYEDFLTTGEDLPSLTLKIIRLLFIALYSHLPSEFMQRIATPLMPGTLLNISCHRPLRMRR